MASFSLAACAWPWSRLAQSELWGKCSPHSVIKEQGSVVQSVPFSVCSQLCLGFLNQKGSGHPTLLRVSGTSWSSTTASCHFYEELEVKPPGAGLFPKGMESQGVTYASPWAAATPNEAWESSGHW